MRIFEQGAIVRVPFPYTDRNTLQRRPALVISARGGLGESRALLWVLMITSAENRPWSGDVSFGAAYRSAGLPAPSVVRTSKIATIEEHRAEPIGHAGSALLEDVLHLVRSALGIAQ